MDVWAALAIVFRSHPVPRFLEYPVQCTIASVTLVTLIQQLSSSFGTIFSSTAVIPVHQFFSSEMISPAVCSSEQYGILQVPLFGTHSYVYVS